jgi:hypothetical protein
MKKRVSQAVGEFRKLSSPAQAAIVAITVWNLWLTVSAELDIQRAPANEVRGRKVFWRLVSLTNTVGPLAYFRWGRRRETH